jgi:hypothetical protein
MWTSYAYVLECPCGYKAADVVCLWLDFDGMPDYEQEFDTDMRRTL